MLTLKFKELLLELTIFGGGVFALIYIWNQLSATPQEQSVNFATFPIMISSAIILLMGIKLASTITNIMRAKRNQVSDSPHVTSALFNYLVTYKKFLARAFGTVAFCLLYTFLLQKVNFLLLTVIFLWLMFYLYGQKNILKISVMSVVGSVVLYGLFVNFLNLPL